MCVCERERERVGRVKYQAVIRVGVIGAVTVRWEAREVLFDAIDLVTCPW